MKKGKEKVLPIESVIFLICTPEQVLLEKRINDEHAQGLITPLGGHIEEEDRLADDYFMAAAIREAEEEIGIIANSPTFLLSIEHTIPSGDLYLSYVYLISDWQGEIINREPEKMELIWVNWEEAEGVLPLPATKVLITKAREYLCKQSR